MTTLESLGAGPGRRRAGRLRSDAQRNRDAIVAAARDAFFEQGLDASLEEIARRAGVGIATLYRRFPTRGALVDAVLADVVQAHVAVAERALAMDDPWEGFVFFVEETCRLQAADRGFKDMLSMRFPGAPGAEAAKSCVFDVVEGVIRRAVEAGRLRPDFTLADLAFLTWSHAGVVEATAEVAPDAWRRHLGFLLDGFRAERAGDLPAPPLTPEQINRSMLDLARRRTGGGGQGRPTGG